MAGLSGEFYSLVIVLLVFFFVMTVFRLFKATIGGPTLVASEIDDYLADPDYNPDFCSSATKRMTFSVVYICSSEVCVIREQLTCLSHLIASAFDDFLQYEFLCFIPPEFRHIIPTLSRLANQFTSIRIFAADSASPTQNFMLASCFARGRIVVDARQLCYEIDELKTSLQRRFIRFLCPWDHLFCFRIPIAGDKLSLLDVFRDVHCSSFGSSYEIDLVCQVHAIEVQTVSRPFGKRSYSIFSSWAHRFMQWFIFNMYYFGVWSMHSAGGCF
jgi:hypothetical protein